MTQPRITFRKTNVITQTKYEYEIRREGKQIGRMQKLGNGRWYLYALDGGPPLNTSSNPMQLDVLREYAKKVFNERR